MTPPTKQAADQRHAGTDNAAYLAMRMQLQAFIARRVENTPTAEDLTQEVLLRLVRSNADPAAWLYRVARNVIIDTTAPAARTLPGSKPASYPTRSTPSPTIHRLPAKNLPNACAHSSTSSTSPTDPRSPPWTSTGEPTPPSAPRPG